MNFKIVSIFWGINNWNSRSTEDGPIDFSALIKSLTINNYYLTTLNNYPLHDLFIASYSVSSFWKELLLNCDNSFVS